MIKRTTTFSTIIYFCNARICLCKNETQTFLNFVYFVFKQNESGFKKRHTPGIKNNAFKFTTDTYDIEYTRLR